MITAILHLTRLAISVAPNDVSAYNNLAAAYIGVGKEDEAISYLKKVLKMDPHNFETRMNYATLLNERGTSNTIHIC